MSRLDSPLSGRNTTLFDDVGVLILFALCDPRGKVACVSSNVVHSLSSCVKPIGCFHCFQDI